MLSQGIALPGIQNARELGGYVIGSRHIGSSVLLRTAGLDQATPEALDALQNRYHVQTVIDFRMSSEQGSLPDPEIPGAENRHLPVIEMEDMLIDVDPALVEKYTDPNIDRLTLFNIAYESGMLNARLYEQFLLAERGKNAFRAFFEALLKLEEGRAILWHCTDGKDRTGCAAMLLLYALGADRETVLRDYLLTNDCNAPKLAAIRQKIAPLGWPREKVNALLFMSGGVFAVYMDNAIRALNDAYGSVMEYLRQALGVDAEAIAALRRKFLI